MFQVRANENCAHPIASVNRLISYPAEIFAKGAVPDVPNPRILGRSSRVHYREVLLCVPRNRRRFPLLDLAVVVFYLPNIFYTAQSIRQLYCRGKCL